MCWASRPQDNRDESSSARCSSPEEALRRVLAIARRIARRLSPSFATLLPAHDRARLLPGSCYTRRAHTYTLRTVPGILPAARDPSTSEAFHLGQGEARPSFERSMVWVST